jgi:hypothetical protein
MLKTTRVRLFEDAHRESGCIEKKILVETWLRENLGPCGPQAGRRWFFRYNRKRPDFPDSDEWTGSIYHLDVYFRDPADATFFRLKWI